MMKLVSQRGDTLVEVMISLAIIGSVIGIAYSTASRSLQVGRNAQERTEALKIAEGQIEQLKLRSSADKLKLGTDATSVYASRYTRVASPASSFCLASSTLIVQEMIAQDMLGSPGDSLAFNPVLGPPAGVQVYHNSCAVGIANRYKVSIEREDNILSSTFTIRVRWERLGTGKDEIKIMYRLHKGQV